MFTAVVIAEGILWLLDSKGYPYECAHKEVGKRRGKRAPTHGRFIKHGRRGRESLQPLVVVFWPPPVAALSSHVGP
jgi:hypothetical protein